MRKSDWLRNPWLWASLAVVAGALLRLAYPAEMEWKSDEQAMWRYFQEVGTTQPWPWLGMPSGVYVRNPGMSVWVFLGLGHLVGATDPLHLGMAVMAINSLALALLLAVIHRQLRTDPQREAWLWALALAAVNPILVLYHRKIWAQSTLPLLCVAWIWSFFARGTRQGALALGLLGACLGQVHMSGFFFALAMTLVLWIRDRSSVRWGPWLLGSAAGAMPLLPWIWHFLHRPPGNPIAFGWNEAIQLKAWVFFITDSLGLTLGNALGVHRGNGPLLQLEEFLKLPGMTAAHLLLAGLGAFGLIRGAPWVKRILWNDRSTTGLLLLGAFLLYPLLLTLSTIVVHRYYLLVTFPLECLWLSTLLLRPGAALGRRLLILAVALQLAVSIQFLGFVRSHGGAPEGDYGVSYRQQKTPLPPR